MRYFSSLLFALFFSLIISTPSLQAATITPAVSTDAFDGNVCTLRNAIEALNQGNNFGGCSASNYGTNDTVMLEAGTTYVLSVDNTGGEEDCNIEGDFSSSRL